MSSSRAQSQSSRYSRNRSNTVQSAYKSIPTPAPPLLTPAPSVRVGESNTLAAWVHDPEKSPAVIFNHNWWPGIDEGDLLRVTLGNPDSGFLFFVPREDQNLVKPQLQVRIPSSHPHALSFSCVTPLPFPSQDIHPRKYRRGVRYQKQRRNHSHKGTQRSRLSNLRYTNLAPKLPIPSLTRILARPNMWNSRSKTSTSAETKCGGSGSTSLGNAFTSTKTSRSSA